MWKEIPPFSFSAGERKIMAHFVVKSLFSSSVAATALGLCGEYFFTVNPGEPKLVSFSQRLQAFQCVDIVRAEGENFTILTFCLGDFSQLRVSLPERQSPIVPSSSHAQSFAVGFGGFVPPFELEVDGS